MDKDITLDKERPTPSSGEGKISTIFLIVLGLHILVIIGISAHYLIKGSHHNSETAKTEDLQTTPPNDGAALPDKGDAATTAAGDTTGTVPQTGTVAPATGKTFDGAKVTDTTPTPNDYIIKDGAQPGTDTPALPPLQKLNPTAGGTKPAAPVIDQGSAVVESTPAIAIKGDYTVVKGDTLTKIAHKTGVKVAALKQANKLNSDNLKIGQKLALPAGAKIVATAPAPAAKIGGTSAKPAGVIPVAPTETASASGSYGNHEVAKGETLMKIARMYNTSADKLAKLNDITDPKKLKIGMKLRVPAQGAVGSTVSTPAAPAATSSTTASASPDTVSAGSTAPAPAFRTAPETTRMAMNGASDNK